MSLRTEDLMACFTEAKDFIADAPLDSVSFVEGSQTVNKLIWIDGHPLYPIPVKVVRMAVRDLMRVNQSEIKRIQNLPYRWWKALYGRSDVMLNIWRVRELESDNLRLHSGLVGMSYLSDDSVMPMDKSQIQRLNIPSKDD